MFVIVIIFCHHLDGKNINLPQHKIRKILSVVKEMHEGVGCLADCRCAWQYSIIFLQLTLHALTMMRLLECVMSY